MNFTVPGDNWIKLKESEKNDKYLDLARELKKTAEYESDDNTNCDFIFWYNHQKINKGTGGLRNERTSGDHPNYYIVDNGQIIEKSHRDLMRLAVTQTPVKTIIDADVKNSQRVNNNNNNNNKT